MPRWQQRPPAPLPPLRTPPGRRVGRRVGRRAGRRVGRRVGRRAGRRVGPWVGPRVDRRAPGPPARDERNGLRLRQAVPRTVLRTNTTRQKARPHTKARRPISSRTPSRFGLRCGPNHPRQPPRRRRRPSRGARRREVWAWGGARWRVAQNRRMPGVGMGMGTAAAAAAAARYSLLPTPSTRPIAARARNGAPAR